MPTHTGYVNANGTPIDLTVKVWTRPNLRAGVHEMMLYSGKAFLENIFDKKVVDTKTTYVWAYYPETWCNIPELQALVEWIPKFYPNVTKVEITTHSVYIIQTVRSEQIGIYDKPDDFPQQPYDHTRHLAPPPEHLKGLHVFSPDGSAKIKVSTDVNLAEKSLAEKLAEADQIILKAERDAESAGITKKELDAGYDKFCKELDKEYAEVTGKKWPRRKSKPGTK